MVSSRIRTTDGWFTTSGMKIHRSPKRYCSEQTIFLYFWKIHYNINKIYYVSVYFNLILYNLIDYNDLNVLFSSNILKTKKH